MNEYPCIDCGSNVQTIVVSTEYCLIQVPNCPVPSTEMSRSVPKCPSQGRIQDFKLWGAHLKKLRRAEGGAKIFGVFRVKNHDFTPKKSYFSNFRGGGGGGGGGREIFGIFHVKNHDFTPKKL